VSDYELRLLQALDGRRTVEEVIERLNIEGHNYPPQKAAGIIQKASMLGLLLGTKHGTAEGQAQLREMTLKARRARRFSSAFFLFIPLLNPDKFLERTLWIAKLVFNKWSAGLLALALPGAICLLLVGLSKFDQQHLFFFNIQNLIYLWITIALTKLIHEFAHAYTAKHFGLHVPQMGIAFLIFFPCLFCNTTDAWRLGDRKQRVAIAAAGVTSEIALAVISTYIWYFSKPCILNSLAFYLMAVSSVSTVLFNGNPLLKFDGYFILSDLLGTPNLMTKSIGYMRYLFFNKLLGMDQVASPASTLRECFIFGGYGVGTFLYRLVLYTSIVAGVYYRFDKALGTFLAILAFSLFVVRPLWRGIVGLHARRSQVRVRSARFWVFAGLVGIIVFMLFVPVSRNSVYPCVVGPLFRQKLAVPLLTSVEKAYVLEGSTVRQGEPLFVLDTNQLKLALLKKEIERGIILEEMEMLLVDENQRAQAGEKRSELSRVEHEIRTLKSDLDLAEGGIKAPFDAAITKLDFRVQPGFQPGKGVVVGEMQSIGATAVYALIPEEDLHEMREGMPVTVWFGLGSGITLHEKINLIRAVNERDLKDSPLSSRFGGGVATEVRGENEKDVPIAATYICMVRIDREHSGIPLGITGKLFVPFPPRSLAAAWLETAVKTFNRESLF
jgi:putative peptide zinc metalloprotease protein